MLTILRFFNDSRSSLNLLRQLYSPRNLLRSNLNSPNFFRWPEYWPKQEPLAEIVSYALMPNHYHLLLREIIPGGISAFIKKLGNGYTAYFNVKYSESGKVFQGSYQARLINGVRYLQYVDTYIQVLNPLELLPNRTVLGNFDASFGQILKSPFNSIKENLGSRNFSITERKQFLAISNLPTEIIAYEAFVRNIIFDKGLKKFLGNAAIEEQ
ncbi:MAG TPA: transposase [Candidatus Paceibacterota bacterium]|nr:transposase [Candidatus Pacearchaeota archaeon]HRZ50569.1 transposase [Candidatus Paceibacterota bacterium]HSA36290.1 transposase [Candidatus Paceibacterota bacterium]